MEPVNYILGSNSSKVLDCKQISFVIMNWAQNPLTQPITVTINHLKNV